MTWIACLDQEEHKGSLFDGSRLPRVYYIFHEYSYACTVTTVLWLERLEDFNDDELGATIRGWSRLTCLTNLHVPIFAK